MENCREFGQLLRQGFRGVAEITWTVGKDVVCVFESRHSVMPAQENPSPRLFAHPQLSCDSCGAMACFEGVGPASERGRLHLETGAAVAPPEDG